MARTARVLLVFVLAGCANASSLAPGMKAVEEIRGRKFTKDVRNIAIDRADLARHLERQMKMSTPYPLEDWGRVLRALQLVDVKNTDIVPKLLALYESQVLAFYDPHSHTYYSINQMPKLPESAKLVDPKMLEETVMVHELTHALQDQHYSLGPKEKTLMRDTDASLAYHAVLEGEAVLVMMAHMMKKMGVDIDEVLQDDAMLNLVTSSATAEQFMDASAPKYFGEMLKFPYLEGVKFVIAAYKRGGWKEIDKVHASPPRTTREILHPEEYFARTFKPGAFSDAKPNADTLAVEHLGEFHWRFLVGADNARGWMNDRVVVSRGGQVHAETTWESPERATAFADAYGAFLKKRGVEAKLERSGASVVVDYTAK